MNTVIDFVAYCIGFLPFLSLVAIALAVFWILCKMIPSLGAWMSAADVDEETDADRRERIYASRTSRNSW